MKEEIFDAVVTEILDELRQVNRALKEQGISIKEMNDRVEGFEQKLRDQQVIVQPPDLGLLEKGIQVLLEQLREESKQVMETMEGQMGEGLKRVTEAVEKQPKPIHRHVRLSIFPESDKGGSYRYFIGWLFGGMILALVVLGLFVLGRQYLDERRPAATPSIMTTTNIPGDLHRRTDINRPAIHGLTSREARRKVDSMVRVEKIKRILDTFQNTAIQHLPDTSP